MTARPGHPHPIAPAQPTAARPTSGRCRHGHPTAGPTGTSRRLVAALATAALLATTLLLGAPPSSAATSFSDVPPSHIFYDEIMWLADSGITTGFPDGTFRPLNPISRQAMAAFFYRLEGEPTGPFPNPGFTDVPPTHPYFTEIAWLADTGITGGYPDGGFHPGASVTRQAMAAFFYRLEGEPAGPFPNPGFTDVPPTHPFFDEIAWLADTGITGGYADGGFHPGASVTRQAMAAFFYRLAGPTPTELVSRRTDGTAADAGSEAPSISADGRYVAFQSDATTLVPGDTNGVTDIFVHDRVDGTTTRVSVTTGGAQADAASYDPEISGNGRYVVFASVATNLSALDGAPADVFRHDLVTHQTELISIALNDAFGNDDSEEPTISADGSVVAFQSWATNLLDGFGDQNATADVYVADLDADTLVRASVDTFEEEADGSSGQPDLSPDGLWVAFVSGATNLGGAGENNVQDIYLRSLVGQDTTLVSGGDGGVGTPEANDQSSEPVVSNGGAFVAFRSSATNLVAGDENGVPDVFLYEFATSSTTRVSVGVGGGELGSDSEAPSISDDGRYVAFEANTDLVPADTNAEDVDVYLRDTDTEAVTLVSVALSGESDSGGAWAPALAGGGGAIAFVGGSDDFVLGDANGQADVFARDLAP